MVGRYCWVESYATSRGGARSRLRRSSGPSGQDSNISSLLRHDVQRRIADRGATRTIATPNSEMIRDEEAAQLIICFVMESSTAKVSACRSSVIEIIGSSRRETQNRATRCSRKPLRSLGTRQMLATMAPAVIKNQTMFRNASIRSFRMTVVRSIRETVCTTAPVKTDSRQAASGSTRFRQSSRIKIRPWLTDGMR